MKRTLFFTLLAIFITTISFGQKKTKEKYGYDIHVGAKVGLNFNQIKGKSWQEEYRTNPTAGLFLALNGHTLGIQIEGLWTMNTVVSDTSFAGLYNQYFKASADSLATGKFTFHSFSVPVLLNIKLNQILWVQVGPQYNSLLKVLDNDNLIANGRTIFRDGELSFVGGVWLNVGRVGPLPKFNLGGRFIAGLNNINELGDQTKWRNQSVQLHIGIGF